MAVDLFELAADLFELTAELFELAAEFCELTAELYELASDGQLLLDGLIVDGRWDASTMGTSWGCNWVFVVLSWTVLWYWIVSGAS